MLDLPRFQLILQAVMEQEADRCAARTLLCSSTEQLIYQSSVTMTPLFQTRRR